MSRQARRLFARNADRLAARILREPRPCRSQPVCASAHEQVSTESCHVEALLQLSMCSFAFIADYGASNSRFQLPRYLISVVTPCRDTSTTVY